jgi:plasmid stabilization system protein ParE
MSKKRRLIWTRQARAELRDIQQYIAQRAPQAAKSFVRKIRERCRGLLGLPLAAPMVQEIGRPTFRETYYGSYRIMYVITPESVIITSVRHGARLFPDDANPLE